MSSSYTSIAAEIWSDRHRDRPKQTSLCGRLVFRHSEYTTKTGCLEFAIVVNDEIFSWFRIKYTDKHIWLNRLEGM